MEIIDLYKRLSYVLNLQFDDVDEIADERSVFIVQANNIISYFGNQNSYARQRLYKIIVKST
jgi:hypothetical protein